MFWGKSPVSCVLLTPAALRKCCGIKLWSAAPTLGKAQREVPALWHQREACVRCTLGPKAQSDPRCEKMQAQCASPRTATLVEPKRWSSRDRPLCPAPSQHPRPYAPGFFLPHPRRRATRSRRIKPSQELIGNLKGWPDGLHQTPMCLALFEPFPQSKRRSCIGTPL